MRVAPVEGAPVLRTRTARSATFGLASRAGTGSRCAPAPASQVSPQLVEAATESRVDRPAGQIEGICDLPRRALEQVAHHDHCTMLGGEKTDRKELKIRIKGLAETSRDFHKARPLSGVD